MLENLFDLVREQGQDDVINNPIIPNEQNDAVLASATESVTEGLQGELAGGGLQNMMSLFGNDSGSGNGIGGLLNNPIVQSIIRNFTGKLTNNHGVSGAQAGSIAGSLIPNIIGKLIKRTNDPNDNGFDLGGIIGSLTGGAGGIDLGGLVSNIGGGGMDANGDGKVGLDDIISKVTNGARQQQQAQTSGGGGLLDMIKGFIK